MHFWYMQKVDGAYADPSMRLAIIPTDTPTEATMEALSEDGSALLGAEDCTVVEDGDIMTPAAGGSCFELHVNADADDTEFGIETPGIAGLAIYAQHVPIEFERDRHYLADFEGVDIEPIAQETPEGGHDHDHGRLLQDVDAALHTYEDACDAVGCYVESSGCSAGTPELTDLATLQDRAAKKCHITVEEGTTCSTTATAAPLDTSGAQPMTVLAGVALVLT